MIKLNIPRITCPTIELLVDHHCDRFLPSHPALQRARSQRQFHAADAA